MTRISKQERKQKNVVYNICYEQEYREKIYVDLKINGNNGWYNFGW